VSSDKFLAFDFGAESGRAIVGIVQERLYWDVLYLFDELKNGLAAAAAKGHRDIKGIGVDTWGVDFGLIDKKGQLIGNPVSYRDNRTNGMMEKAFSVIPKEKIYGYTGIQFMQLNTLYQLLSLLDTYDPQIEIADQLLFVPDLFNFMLTGQKFTEYTIASTSQLLDAKSKKWCQPVFKELNLPLHIMPEIVKPGTMLGSLLNSISKETGLNNVDVIAPAGHDTACAVAAVPAKAANWAFLSSGTWSLLGVENDTPIINNKSLEYGFTNEGGANGKIRFLKNIMGMWLFERCRQVWMQEQKKVEYASLIYEASSAKPFRSIIDPDDESFINPVNMVKAVSEYCNRSNQPVPDDKGAIVRCIFESLALKYRSVIEKINTLRSTPVERLHIVGGGSKNKRLNQFIADAVGIPVIAGPPEGTAIGNVMLQAVSKGVINSVEEGRQIISNSFDLQYFEPEKSAVWEDQYNRIKSLF